MTEVGTYVMALAFIVIPFMMMLPEALETLQVRPAGRYVDATLGMGGHAEAIAERLSEGGRLLALDVDAGSLEHAAQRLQRFGNRVFLRQANFERLAEVLADLKWDAVDGVLADLGISSAQLDDPERGLSFRTEGPLDMRLDPTGGRTAADLVNTLSEAALADVFFEFGEERHSRRVARRVVGRRAERPFATSLPQDLRWASGRPVEPEVNRIAAVRAASMSGMAVTADGPASGRGGKSRQAMP